MQKFEILNFKLVIKILIIIKQLIKMILKNLIFLLLIVKFQKKLENV